MQCWSCGITDTHVHALVGDGKHGQTEQSQTFGGQACHTTFSARRDMPVYRLKTPSQQIAVVLAALAEGLDPSEDCRVFGSRQATITTWLTRAGEHAQTLHERTFRTLWLPHLNWTTAAHPAPQRQPDSLAVASDRSPHQESAGDTLSARAPKL